MVKKKISMLLAAVLVASGVAVAAPAKAETKVAITYSAPAQTMVETNDKMEFVLQANTEEAVEYKVWAQNLETKEWIELTDGYQRSEVGTNPFQPETIKELPEGKYKASIWVKKADSEAKYDNFQVKYFSIKAEGYFAERANMDDLGLKDTYKVGESVGLAGDDEYKLHIFDPSVAVRSEGWTIDAEYESAEDTADDYTFTKPGTYMIDVWGRKAGTTNKQGYQGWTLKVVTVTEGQDEVAPTVEVSAGLDSFSRTVKVTLNVEDPENYKVTYTDGTELKYYEANQCFKAVIYSTDEVALGDAANFDVVCTNVEAPEAAVEVSAGLDSFSRTVKVTLDAEDAENYKVTYSDGTELKYYEANKCFKAVIYSTDEAALGNAENFTVAVK